MRYLVGGQETAKCRFRGLGDRLQRTLHGIFSGDEVKDVVSKLAKFIATIGFDSKYSKIYF